MKNGDWIREMGGDVQVFRPLEVAYPTMIAGAGFPHIRGAENAVKYNIKGTPEEGKPSQRSLEIPLRPGGQDGESRF